MTHDRWSAIKGRFGVATIVVALIVPFGVADNRVAASPVLSASPNPFCQAMVATHPTPPTNYSATAYHQFAKKYLSYYLKLQAVTKDPNARSSLKLLVPILRADSRTTNMKSLARYVAVNQLTWAREWQVFDKSVIACAKWAVNLL